MVDNKIDFFFKEKRLKDSYKFKVFILEKGILKDITNEFKRGSLENKPTFITYNESNNTLKFSFGSENTKNAIKRLIGDNAKQNIYDLDSGDEKVVGLGKVNVKL